MPVDTIPAAEPLAVATETVGVVVPSVTEIAPLPDTEVTVPVVVE